MALPGLSLPGLGFSEAAPTPLAASEDASTHASAASKTITLSPNSEYRFELSESRTQPINLKVLAQYPADLPPSQHSEHGPSAEIFGTELAPNHVYSIPPGAKAAVFTHTGCALEIQGEPDSDYVSEETPMTEYVNLHFALETMRDSEHGAPRVLLLGPRDCGKTTLSKILVGYAGRVGRSPMVVSLDPTEGMLSAAGSISACVFGAGGLLDVEDASSNAWGTAAVAGASGVSVKAPLVYHIGAPTPEAAIGIFKPVTTRLALAATSRYEEDQEVKRSGIIVDMPSSSVSAGRDKEGYEAVTHIVGEFSINVIVVIGSEKVFNDMHKKFEGTRGGEEPIHVVKVSRSGGCVERDDAYRKAMTELQIKNYFFGNNKQPLSPQTSLLELGQLTILTPALASQAGRNRFAPGGAEDDEDDEDYEPPGFSEDKDKIFQEFKPHAGMTNALVAIRHAAAGEAQAAIRDASVMGFVFIADVDEAKKKIKILSPVGGRLPLGSAWVSSEYPTINGNLLT